MGTWRNNGTADLLIVSPFKVYTEDKRPYRWELGDIQAVVAQHPNIERYEKKVEHRTTFRQARDAGNIYKVGELRETQDTFDLIGLSRQQTRIFKDLPRVGKDLLTGQYHSTPIVLKEGIEQ
jgi:hypothetical protein